jgi:uncharacterized membrane protein YdbT with pleckstrin-like domain
MRGHPTATSTPAQPSIPPVRADNRRLATDGGAVIDQSRAASFLPAELLQGGEIIILLLKPSPWYILLAALGSLASIIILILAALYLDAAFNLGASSRDLVLLGVGLVIVRLFWQFLEWMSRTYVLTDRRVIRIKGFLRVQVFEASLKQIQHTYAFYSLRERLFRLGTLGFATAGTDTIEALWEMIARPRHVHRAITDAIHRYR